MPLYRVVVVSDHPLFAEIVRGLLDNKYEVEIVGTLEAEPRALRALRDMEPDVLVVERLAGERYQRLWAALDRYAVGVKIVVASTECNTLDIHLHQRLQINDSDDLVTAIRQSLVWGVASAGSVRVLCTSQGRYGAHVLQYLNQNLPDEWSLRVAQLPPIVPQEIEDPSQFTPAALPEADLVIGLGESPGAARLLPHIVRRSGAQAAIVPVNRSEWLPAAVQAELEEVFATDGVEAIFPRPFCSLTEWTFNRPPHTHHYRHPLIAAFARVVGQPWLEFKLDEEEKVIQQITIHRDTPCGCMQSIADQLVGCSIERVVSETGKLHLASSCMAGLSVDLLYNDTLRHVAAGILKDSVRSATALSANAVFYEGGA